MADQWKWATVKRIKEAAEELKATIRAKYPDAEFNLTRAPDDRHGWLLWTTVDVDDPAEVSGLVVERTVDMLVEEHIPISVIAMRRTRPRSAHQTQKVRAAG